MNIKTVDLILKDIREKLENERRRWGTTLKDSIEIHTKSNGVVKGNYISYYKEKIGCSLDEEDKNILCLHTTTKMSYTEGEGKNNYTVVSYVNIDDIDFIIANILNSNEVKNNN